MPTIALFAVLGCQSHSRGVPFHDAGGDPATTDQPTAEEEWEATKGFLCEGDVSLFEFCPCDVTIDWSRLTQDMFGAAVEPGTFRTLGLAGFTHSSVDDFLDDACDQDSLTAASAAGYVEARIEGDTCANIADMSFLDTPGGTLTLGARTSSRGPTTRRNSSSSPLAGTRFSRAAGRPGSRGRSSEATCSS